MSEADDRERLEAAETGQIPVITGPIQQAGQTDKPVRIPREIWVLIGATFLVAAGYGLIVPVLPQYARSFGVEAFLVNIVVSAFALMRLVTAPGAGVLVDRVGERVVYSVGLLIVAASTLATAFAHSYGELLVYRGLGGIGSAMFSLSAQSMVVRFSPPEIRGRVSSLWMGTFLIGNIAGPVMGGLLAQMGLQVPFIGYGVGLFLASIIVFVLLRNSRMREKGARASQRVSFAEAMSWPAYRASLLFAFANGWANLGMRVAVVPLFVAAFVSEEPYAAGLVVAATATGMVAMLQWSGRASDRRGRRPLILVGLVVAAVGLVAMLFTRELWLVCLTGAVAGAGAGLCGPVSQAALGDLIGPNRSGGRALSLYQMTQDAGTIVGPIIAGLIIDTVGFTWSFAAAALVLFVPFLAWLGTADTRRVN